MFFNFVFIAKISLYVSTHKIVYLLYIASLKMITRAKILLKCLFYSVFLIVEKVFF